MMHEIPDWHHLDMKKGFWRLRMTVCRGRKVIGKRLVIHLATQDPQEAITRRELIFQAYRQLGLEIADRRIRKRGASVSAVS